MSVRKKTSSSKRTRKTPTTKKATAKKATAKKATAKKATAKKATAKKATAKKATAKKATAKKATAKKATAKKATAKKATAKKATAKKATAKKATAKKATAKKATAKKATAKKATAKKATAKKATAKKATAKKATANKATAEKTAGGPAAPVLQEPEIAPLVIGGVSIAAGERQTVELPVARLPTSTDVIMRVHVVRGKKPGPTLFVSAAVHGDEVNGVDIVSRLLRMKALSRLRGTLIAVPVVNMFGFIGHSRYLPDRRDLNRSFPGSEGGSLAARLAQIFGEEVLANSTHGIDLHTGGLHRTNLPQVRINSDDPVALELANQFGALVVLRSPVRPGSLRAEAAKKGVPILVYEGGEALRFDEWAIKAGLRGVVSIMHYLEMLPPRRPGTSRPAAARPAPVVADRTRWVRAPAGGILRARAKLGSRVSADDVLATIGDPHGGTPVRVRAAGDAIVIGHAQLPVVNEGDALFHLLRLDEGHDDDQLGSIEAFQAAIEPRGFEHED